MHANGERIVDPEEVRMDRERTDRNQRNAEVAMSKRMAGV
jgi:hypothetical protein